MRSRISFSPSLPPPIGVSGLPKINYYLPMVATLLATIVVFLMVAALTLVALGNAASQLGQFGSAQGSVALGGFCGILGLVGMVSTLYFFLAMIKGVRDLVTPVYYTRGEVVDKKTVGGRKSGNWLRVVPRYTGADKEAASAVSDEQQVTSVDRSRIVQPRFSSSYDRTKARGSASRWGSYLGTSRILRDSGPAPAKGSRRKNDRIDRIAAQSFGSEAFEGTAEPRVVFRIEPVSFEILEPGEEVLIAHSRYLQHVFYVAHLKDGDWESFPNKALI